MNLNQKSYQFGIFLWLLSGIGHLSFEALAHWRRFNPDAWSSAELTMASLPEEKLLGKSIRIFELMNGFSAAMGLLLIIIGCLLLTNRESRINASIAILASAIMLIIALLAFPPYPIATMSLSMISFGWYIMTKPKKALG